LHYLGGKILRLNRDGSIPADIPSPAVAGWTLGNRTAGWPSIPSTATWATEHGPSVNGREWGNDEVNLIQRGKNYGWPLIMAPLESRTT
jgi:glucose/arabinose dehydrogenase